MTGKYFVLEGQGEITSRVESNCWVRFSFDEKGCPSSIETQQFDSNSVCCEKTATLCHSQVKLPLSLVLFIYERGKNMTLGQKGWVEVCQISLLSTCYLFSLGWGGWVTKKKNKKGSLLKVSPLELEPKNKKVYEKDI